MVATGRGGDPGGCVDADVTVRDYMRGGTPPSHRLDPGIGPNDLLLLLVLTLLRRVMNDLHLLWLQWLLLLLILRRWCTGRPRRYNITDVSPLHQYVLAAKISTDWAGRRNGNRSGRTPGTRNADDLGMLEFRRGLGRSYYPLLGLRLRLLGLLKLLLRRLLLLLLLVLGGGDNTNGARVGLAGGGVHVPDDDRGGLTTDDGARRHYPLGVDQAGTDLIPHDRPSKAGRLILSTSGTTTTDSTATASATSAPIAVAAIARVRV